MTFANERIVILYGSQTGNAQDLAERIWRESKRFFFRSTVQALDEYNVLELINETCAVFVCSTTGEGEEPDNMKSFWKFLLRKSLPSDTLLNLRWVIFYICWYRGWHNKEENDVVTSGVTSFHSGLALIPVYMCQIHLMPVDWLFNTHMWYVLS